MLSRLADRALEDFRALCIHSSRLLGHEPLETRVVAGGRFLPYAATYIARVEGSKWT